MIQKTKNLKMHAYWRVSSFYYFIFSENAVLYSNIMSIHFTCSRQELGIPILKNRSTSVDYIASYRSVR